MIQTKYTSIRNLIKYKQVFSQNANENCLKSSYKFKLYKKKHIFSPNTANKTLNKTRTY
jgi:hypothetical protein